MKHVVHDSKLNYKILQSTLRAACGGGDSCTNEQRILGCKSFERGNEQDVVYLSIQWRFSSCIRIICNILDGISILRQKSVLKSNFYFLVLHLAHQALIFYFV